MEPQALSRSTIAAIATPAGQGGLAVIRISGPEAFDILSRIWRGKNPHDCPTHTAHLGTIMLEDGSVLDQAVATFFRAPASFTGEDTVELSIHGSRWIQREAMNLLVRAGASPAGPGEFSQRAFLNGRMDLVQTEAIADIIAAGSRGAHRMAMQQLSGSFSSRLNQLREKLVNFASLLELELDFSEEDVTFADRQELIALAGETLETVNRLADSYARGRALRDGIPVVIAGAPNAGKSTLLNRLIDDDKALVSDVPGTTRDVIEDCCEIDGTLFRFFDTAGLHHTEDTVELMGIDRAKQYLSRAAIILWVCDTSDPAATPQADPVAHGVDVSNATNILVLNKIDKASYGREQTMTDPVLTAGFDRVVSISARQGTGIDELQRILLEISRESYGADTDLVVTNARHYEALRAGAAALTRALEGLRDGLSGDLVAQDMREALHHLGLIVGAVTTDTLLTSIFSKFCIGK